MAVAYQFVHVNTYSSKTGAAGIAAEAAREPEHCPHVENPQEPVLLAGVGPLEAWAEIERRKETARNTVTLKSGATAQRRLRSDENVLLAAVASYPELTGTVDIDGPEFQDWQKRTIDWLTEQHGKPLSVVLHLDESHPHIHFMAAPDLENGQRMADIHAGEKAKAEIGGRSAGKIAKERAYSKAMSGYQDSYHEQVGQHHAQARMGPRRLRLTRDEWKAQQAELKRQAERLKEIERQRQEIAAAGLDLDAEKTAVAAGRDEVAAARAELEAREQAVTAAQKNVNNEHKKLDTRRDKLKATNDRLKTAIADVSARERRLAGIWGTVVGVITFGRMGTEKRVEKAVNAVKSDFQDKLERQAEELKNADTKHSKAVYALAQEKSRLTDTNQRLRSALQKSEKARQKADKALAQVTEKIGPLEAENSALAADRNALKALLTEIEEAALNGDMAAVQSLVDPGPDDLEPGLRM